MWYSRSNEFSLNSKQALNKRRPLVKTLKVFKAQLVNLLTLTNFNFIQNTTELYWTNLSIVWKKRKKSKIC